MEINKGPNKGYFFLPTQFINDGSIVNGNQIFSRFKLSNNKKIQGFNSTYLPYIDGYYYIPKDTQIDIRKLAYALENKLIPSTGNTETFNTEFKNIVVPNNYCPYYLKPCFYDWCQKCDEGKKVISKTYNLHKLTEEQLAKRNNLIWIFSLFLATILILAFLSS